MLAPFQGRLHAQKAGPPSKRTCIFLCFSSELPSHAQLGVYAALFAGPAVDVQIYVHVGGDFGAEAQFQHAAAAFDRGAGGGLAIVGSSGAAVEFVLVGKACVDFLTLVQGVGEAQPQAHTGAVDAVEVKNLGRAHVGGDGDTVAALMGVVVFQLADAVPAAST